MGTKREARSAEQGQHGSYWTTQFELDRKFRTEGLETLQPLLGPKFLSEICNRYFLYTLVFEALYLTSPDCLKTRKTNSKYFTGVIVFQLSSHTLLSSIVHISIK